MKVPPHLEELVWRVADDPRLDEEFEARYPDLVEEMLARRALNLRMRAIRPTEDARPEFRLREGKEPDWREKTAWAAAAGFVALSVVAAAFGAAAYVFRPQEAAKPEPPVVVVNPPGSEPREQARPDPRDQEPFPAEPPQTSPAPPPAPEDPLDRLITIDIKRASLTQVLDSIAVQAGIELTYAPGMPDPMVEARYVETSAIAAMNDLGRNFGFSALAQGRRGVLLVPARQPEGGASPPSAIPSQPGVLPDLDSAPR